MRLLFFAFLVALFVAPLQAIEPQKVDVSKTVFYPQRWKAAEIDFEMLAWRGDKVTLLTKQGEYDREKLTAFVSVLDQGWKTQLDLVGVAPRTFRQLDGRATICALPQANLSCGYGCGYVGATGIEVAGFYNKDWPNFQSDPKSFAHYYFYEMGRNYFVFGDRHSLFTTGYAVFIRYVCMDKVGVMDRDLKTRETIESCEQIYADSEVKFYDAFTNLGTGEKRNRLKDASGRTIAPSDQPVMYATAMLKLRRDHGGDQWTKSFLHHLRSCRPYKARTIEEADGQCMNWLVCASAAAGEDLCGVFVDRWRMPLSDKQREIMESIDWEKVDVPATVDRLLAASGS